MATETRPSATIIVTTCDRAELAAQAIGSALAQTVADVEVIVVDDGSKDPLRPPNDPRLSLIRLDRPVGVCAARNRALAAARGEFVCFLDDDDELLPHMIAVSLEAARASKLAAPVAVLSGMEFFGPEVTGEQRLPVTLERGRHYFLEDESSGSFQVHNTLVAPLEVLREIGGWDEQIAAWEHDDLFLRLNAVCSLQGVPSVTYRKRTGVAGQLSRRDLALAEGMRRTEIKHRAVFSTRPKRHAHFLRAMGMYYLRAGRWGRAIAGTSRALVRDPKRPKSLVCWLASLGGPPGLWVFRRARHLGRGLLARPGPGTS